MNMIKSSDLLQFAADLAKDYRNAVIQGSTEYVTSVVVGETVMGPNGYRVPCGESSFPRCHADQYKSDGWLTITSMDNGYEIRHYAPGQWASCTVFQPDGHIAYAWEASINQ